MRFLDVGGGNITGEWYEGHWIPFGQTPQEPHWTSLNIDPSVNPDILGNVENLPFCECTFSLVRLMYFPASSLSKRAVDEAHRVLQIGGTIIIVTGMDILGKGFTETFTNRFSAIKPWNSGNIFLGLKDRL